MCVFGVKVGDEALGEYVEKPANIWGGGELSDVEKNVLNLPKKFRINVKVDDIAMQTEIEKGMIKIRCAAKNGESNEMS